MAVVIRVVSIILRVRSMFVTLHCVVARSVFVACSVLFVCGVVVLSVCGCGVLLLVVGTRHALLCVCVADCWAGLVAVGRVGFCHVVSAGVCVLVF